MIQRLKALRTADLDSTEIIISRLLSFDFLSIKQFYLLVDSRIERYKACKVWHVT